MARPKAEIPIIFSAHHASAKFSHFSSRCALTPEEQLRFSDYGTNITVPGTGGLLVSGYSRGLVDLNRAPDHPALFPAFDFGKPERNRIWYHGREPTEVERVLIQGGIYDRYHAALERSLREIRRPALVVGWDNTAHYIIGNNEAGEPVMMQNVILSNGGREGSAYPKHGEITTCDPALLELFADRLRKALGARGLCTDIYFNLVYKGGYIPQRYNTRRNTGPQLEVSHGVQSLPSSSMTRS
ncbi:N-formylglutamate amidohydrolase [Candidatus Woesebacteria bacterium]|nr:N-formylglutamate amidohydrolase [Candidatus Woesebacteria bacterium]